MKASYSIFNQAYTKNEYPLYIILKLTQISKFNMSDPLISREVVCYSQSSQEDPKIEQPGSIKHALYEHQKTILYRKWILDKSRVIQIPNEDAVKRFSAVTSDQLIVTSDAQHVELPPGSGKTPIEIVYTYMYPKPRKIIPRTANSIIGYSWEETKYVQVDENQHHMNKNEHFNEFRMVVSLMYEKSINPVAYVCKPLVQVMAEIKRFCPQLKVFTIRDAKSLKQFRDSYNDGSINKYDMVIIKYTSTTVSFNLEAKCQKDDDEYIVPDDGKIYNMTDAINIIMKGCAFQRAIYDDYDTVKFAQEAKELNAHYVTLVSGTNDERQLVENKRDVRYNSLTDMFRQNMHARIWDFPRDRVACETFGCIVEKDYMKRSMNLPHYVQYMYVFDNPNDKYIHLMGVMGNANEIMEALNGDAIKTAAEKLGMKTDSVADMFAKLLGKSYDAYIADKHILRVIYALIRYYTRYASVLPDHPRGRYSEAELSSIDNTVVKLSEKEGKREATIATLNISLPPRDILDENNDVLPEYSSKIIKYNSRNILDELNDLAKKYENKKEMDGAAVKRVQDNLRGGCCDVCRFPVAGRINARPEKAESSDEDVSDDVSEDVSSDDDSSDDDSDDSDVDVCGDEGIFIPKCCGIIVCEICFKTSFHVHQYHDRKANADILAGKCAKCPNRVLNIKTDIIYINPEFDMNSIMHGFGTEKAPEIVEEDEDSETEVDDTPKIENPKLRAIWCIYHGRKAENRKKIKEKMFYYKATEDRPERWMIDPGTYDAPVPEGTPIKILCFAPFNETLNMIRDFCDEHGMKYRNLKGTDLQINQIINEIQEKPESVILLVNSEVNCSSLNMQGFTDMVEMCDIKDEHKKIQMRGRLQRIGRKFQARYHILRYKNEAGEYKNSDEIL